jgi:hypothetical protein
VPGLIRQLPHHRPWMMALSVIAVVVVVATCAMGSFLLVKDDSTVVGADPLPTETVPKRDISSREVDPKPLTVADVFPNENITVDPSIPPYKRVGNAQAATDCRVAASGELGKLLVTLGCNQVIRATYTSTEGAYVVTAGIFNLKASASATQDTDIKGLVDGSKGRFSGYVSGTAAKMLGRASTKLAWNAQGHFIVYAVIARTDGKEFLSEDDAHIKIIVYDILEKYLRDGALGDWAVDKSSLGPSGAATVKPTG